LSGQLSGQVKALVTGGSAGLGRAFVDELAGSGVEVVSIDRAAPEGETQATHLPCDLADRAAVDDLLPRLVEAGPFDLVIFNAGISATGRFEKIPLDAHLRLLTVNAETPIVLCAALASAGSIAPGATMVFVSSLSHMTGYPGAASYAASKDAVAVYAKSIRKPFHKDIGVRVCCAFPPPIRTGHAARHAPPEANAEKRMAPEEAARLILRDAASGRAMILPGAAAKGFALAGGLLPNAVTRAMRRIIFEKLDREVF
jgi:short-subunit dehydrogenase